MMSLRRKLVYQMAALMCCLLLVGTAALWGLYGLRSDFGAALAGYQTLRTLYQIGAHVETARTLIDIKPPQTDTARAELHKAMEVFEVGFPQKLSGDQQSLHDALAHAIVDPDIGSSLDDVYQPLVNLDVDCRQSIEAAQTRADQKRKLTTIGMAVLLAAAALGAALIGAAQYHSVVRPLMRLKNAVDTIASGRLSERVNIEGATEFADLARQFNRMASELEASYRDLQQKVEAKSRELVKNERLASVGFLAAGVAHEINNPLGIMTAHAELALGAVGRKDASAQDECEKALKVVCEEAFRCKRIVEKLLTLARSPLEPPAKFSLGALAAEAAAAVMAMPEYNQRKMVTDIPKDTADFVLARSGEIRQAILNLLFNALEATDDGGEVRLSVAKADGAVQLSVIDTGRGMNPGALEQLFEPFFTDARGKADPDARRGTGLGLAITHAIVTRYGGQIRAFSDGIGKGSRLEVMFPEARA